VGEKSSVEMSVAVLQKYFCLVYTLEKSVRGWLNEDALKNILFIVFTFDVSKLVRV